MQEFRDLQSDTSKLVFLYLDRVGDATPTEITDRLNLSLLTVSATVQHLVECGLVRRLDGTERVVVADAARPDRTRVRSPGETPRAGE